MARIKSFTASPFGSAIAGGLVVALLGWAAIAAGWIEGESGDGSSALAPAALPETDDAAQRGGGNTVNEIYRRDAPGVAFVRAEAAPEPPSPLDPFGGGGGAATGSGFVIDDEGHVLTNAHVVEGADRIEVTLGEDSEAVRATLVGVDPSTDLALLEVDLPAEDLHPLPLGDASELEVGDPVVAIGNPFGLDRTATTGIVSALQREITAPNGFTISNVVQTDAAINPGNSGGPLIDGSGRVVGINSQIESPGGGNVGIGFAVPVNTAREVVRQLLETGEVRHAFLGITGADVTEELGEALNLPVDRGVLVQSVVPDGPAADAGIEGGDAAVAVGGQRLRAGGDIITAVDGNPVDGMDDVIAVVNEHRPGDELELEVARGSEHQTLTVTLEDRPARAER